MLRRLIPVVAIMAVMTAPGLAQMPSEALARKLQFMTTMRREATQDGAASSRAAARRYMAAAESRVRSGQPWSSDLFQEAALAHLRAGEPMEAGVAYERLEATAETNSWRAYAAFRLGEILLKRGDWNAANAAFQRALAATQADMNRDHDLIVRSSLGVATSLRELGDRNGAVAARRSVIEQPWASDIEPEKFAIACVESARDCFELGNRPAGRAWFDTLFSMHPTFGSDDGRFVLLRLERALAGRQPGAELDADTIQQLVAVFNDPTLFTQPEVMVCASNLATALDKQGRVDEELQVLVTARVRFAQNRAGWAALPDQHRFAEAVDSFEGITVDCIQILRSRQEWLTVLTVANDLLQQFPSTTYREILESAIAEAHRQLQ